MLRIKIIALALLTACVASAQKPEIVIEFALDLHAYRYYHDQDGNPLQEKPQIKLPEIIKGQTFGIKLPESCSIRYHCLWEIKEPLDPKLSLTSSYINPKPYNPSQRPDICHVIRDRDDTQIFYFKAEQAGLAQIILQYNYDGEVEKEVILTVDIFDPAQKNCCDVRLLSNQLQD